MANLQYIGARYVPKFYTNPDYPAPDDRNNDWKSGVFYEALTIVTYNNDSYTSKKFVPDDIGNPADNVDYWACTTKYTAALMALQTTVQNLEDYVNPDLPLETVAQTIAGAINELNMLAVFVTPEMFGAKGDGVTDDTSALQQCFNAGNFIVFGKNKTYLVSDTINVSSNTFVLGNQATIKIADGSAITTGILGCNTKTNIIIRDIIFNNNVANQPGYSVDVPDSLNVDIMLSSCINVKISGCTFNDIYAVDVQVRACEGEISITDNKFIGATGLYDYWCMCIRCLSNSDRCFLNISDNIFKSSVTNYTYGYGAIFIASQSGKTSIKNNYFEKMGRNSVTSALSPIDIYYNAENVVIDGNTLKTCCMLTRIVSSRHITVVNNQFDDEIETYPNASIIVINISSRYGEKIDTYDVNISNNKIVQKSAGTRTVGINSHYNDIAPHDIIISNNYIKSVAGGVTIENAARDIQILNNCYEMDETSTGAYFVYIDNQTDNEIDAGNIIINNNNVYAVVFIGATSNVIEGNKPSQICNNIAKVATGCLLSIPFLIMGNEFITTSAAMHDGVKFTQQGSEKCYMFNNIFTDKFYATTDTGVEKNKNFYNGVEI